MATTARPHHAYTVGWVCALPKEQTAAIAMLDERHANLPKPPNDPNTYTLGSIGDHNIVIACLPKGKLGTVSAANVAIHMVHAFPGIRFGLMVGIGGGVPAHVRLGDVVVSVPTDQYPGVVQWDMGKTEQGGAFRRTGALNNPPTLLLTALTRLETDHELQGSKIPQYIEEMKERYPRVAAQYTPPNHLEDNLFRVNYDHVNQANLDPQPQYGAVDGEVEESENEAGDSCRYCDRAQLIKRKPRDMRIHYGLIASGNQVVKDARTRDALSSDLGRKVLCIEMEAAGLMDGFPCLVIRGICDYADSHKNKIWQNYAAAVAAAFGKELLGYVISGEVSEEKPANSLFPKVFKTMDTIRENTSKSVRLLNKREDTKTIDWISTIHYGAEQSDTLKRWHSETNQWFLASKKYQYWLHTKGRTLYCPGIPGSGKTIMASAAIEDIRSQFATDPDVGLAYIYFTFSRQREQMREPMLASILAQLLRSQPFLPGCIREIHEKHHRTGTRLTPRELLNVLNDVISGFKRVYIVLDALDECIAANRADILSELLDIQAKTSMNILATSRTHDEIANLLKGPNMTTMPIVACNKDMNIALHSRMGSFDPELYDQDLRERVVSKIVEVAEGMFLLADLHLSALTTLPTKGDIIDVLDHLDKRSDPLVSVYELAMERIESQGNGIAQLARNIILWIVHVRGVLSSKAIQHALAVRPNTRSIDNNYCPSIRTVESICAGLVVIDEESDTVRLVHYTAQEYFEKTCNKWFTMPQDYVMQNCITYLSYDCFLDVCNTDEELEQRIVEFPFYKYASKEWGYHAQHATSEEQALEFLKKEPQLRASIQGGYESYLYWLYPIKSRFQRGCSQNFPKKLNRLHLASYWGLEGSVRALLTDCNVNVKDDCGDTPLSHAAWNGKDAVVELLLGTGKVNIDERNHFGQTPLFGAASNGQPHVVELLLRTGAVDVNLRSRFGHTPLFRAAANGHANVVELFLCNGEVNLNLPDIDGRTPFSVAASNGHANVVDVLLRTGRVNIGDEDASYGRSPLSWAAGNGHATVVEQLLLTRKFDVNLGDKRYDRTPLSWAASTERIAAIRMLLSMDSIEVNKTDIDGRTPLSWAAAMGKAYAVKVLLEETEGIDIDVPDNTGRSPLSWASANGHAEVVRLLLSTGDVNVDLRDQNGHTPLLLAMYPWYEDVIDELLDAMPSEETET